jgi:hypothetical protein
MAGYAAVYDCRNRCIGVDRQRRPRATDPWGCLYRKLDSGPATPTTRTGVILTHLYVGAGRADDAQGIPRAVRPHRCSGQDGRFRSIRICCDMAAATPWRTLATTLGHSKPGSGTRTFSTPFAIPSCRRPGSGTSGASEPGLNLPTRRHRATRLDQGDA